MANNRRFNAWINGAFCTITIAPGESLSHYTSYQTDEGWSGSGEFWELSGDGLELRFQWITEGRDCDGYISHSGESFAVDFDGRKPIWTEESHIVYDQYAQMDNY